MTDPVVIRLQHSFARNLLLPWHGVDQAVFSLVLIGVVFAVLHRLDPGFAIIATASAWAGIVGMLLVTAPAVAMITPAQYAEVVASLNRHGFTHRAATGSWYAPLSRWLRWQAASVTGNPIGDDLVELKGPRLFLKNLLPLSNSRLFVTPLW